jgi:hypothetical protein
MKRNTWAKVIAYLSCDNDVCSDGLQNVAEDGADANPRQTSLQNYPVVAKQNKTVVVVVVVSLV